MSPSPDSSSDLNNFGVTSYPNQVSSESFPFKKSVFLSLTPFSSSASFLIEFQNFRFISFLLFFVCLRHTGCSRYLRILSVSCVFQTHLAGIPKCRNSPDFSHF